MSTTFRYAEGRHGTGELRYINGLPVLTVEGTPEELGEAAGVLALRTAAHGPVSARSAGTLLGSAGRGNGELHVALVEVMPATVVAAGIVRERGEDELPTSRASVVGTEWPWGSDRAGARILGGCGGWYLGRTFAGLRESREQCMPPGQIGKRCSGKNVRTLRKVLDKRMGLTACMGPWASADVFMCRRYSCAGASVFMCQFCGSGLAVA